MTADGKGSFSQKGGRMLKYIGLVSLSLQTATLVLVTRYVRTRPGDLFLSSSAVFMSEVFKIVASLLIGLYVEKGQLGSWFQQLYKGILLQPLDCLKVAVPSMLYIVQNNLLYLAVSSLDAATYQVLYQLKILTTAIVSMLLLGRRLSAMQWLSLVVLFVGVSIVQLQEVKTGGATPTHSPTIGFVAVICATLTSAVAGVYMEKILKGCPTALWLRNTQVALAGMLLGYSAMMWKDGEAVSRKGILHGYDSVVWLLICLHSFGGLMVAMVMRYADNILKGLSTSASIIISCMASIYFFDFELTLSFSVGATLVILAVCIYSIFPPVAVTTKDKMQKDNNHHKRN